MIIFENAGTIDLRCVTNMGVNVKETDNAIGHFGTGLKYAIATLLRNDCQVWLHTGGDAYYFEAREAEVRGKSFKFVTMNGEEIGFTTELGKEWEPWMAYRELYSNMLDEPDGKVISQRGAPDIEKDRTYIVVKGNEINKVHSERHKYFLMESEREPVLHYNSGPTNIEVYEKLRSGQPGVIFYRGIRVGETPGFAAYDYNILSNLHLTEDRSWKYTWEVSWEICRMVLRWTKEMGETHKRVCQNIICAGLGSYEYNLDFRHAPATCTEDLMGVINDLYDDVGPEHMNRSILTIMFENKKKNPKHIKKATLNGIQQKQLVKATTFCEEVLEFDFSDYEIIIREDMPQKQLGEADMDNNVIYLSKRCFEEGTKRVAVALLEEFTHLKWRVKDETLEQKWIYLEQIISLGERIVGEPL